MKVLLLAVTLSLCAAAAVASSHHHSSHHGRVTTRWFELEKGYTFEDYVKEFGKTYSSPAEMQMRKQIFNAHLDKIKRHNRNPTKTWKEGVNHFTDRTADEIVRGHNKHANHRDSVVAARKALSQPFPHHHAPHALPTSIDWRTKNAVTPVKDQSACGSCWTFASAETIESFWFLKTGQMLELSEQQIASCTPNPDDCGGTGGCEGGTAEVAFQGVIDAGGIANESSYPYVSGGGQDYPCSINQTGFSFSPVAFLSSYVKLPVNDQNALLTAVATLGPIAISVDASAWSMYESGVFNGCNMDSPDIDHAVQLVGYGTDPSGGDYWLVRNSWGPGYGEAGYIRIARPTTPPCGVDPTPGDGTACKPYPANITVCGVCGILSDSAYPIVKA